MKKYEYEEKIIASTENLEKALNYWGADGWYIAASRWEEEYYSGSKIIPSRWVFILCREV